MAEFWESVYSSNAKMWGEKPCDNAQTVLKLIQDRGVKNLLIPGFGYGRNARVFYDAGIKVTGIEISRTAIARARQYFGDEVVIHHGSVTDMPFNDAQYHAIYCYSLIHLLSKEERKKLIDDCYKKLEPGGVMVFVAISTSDRRFGEGEEVENHTYRNKGLNLYFCDRENVNEEFGAYNIRAMHEINEPLENPDEKFWIIVCEKNLEV